MAVARSLIPLVLLVTGAVMLDAVQKDIRNHRVLLLERRDVAAEIATPEVGIFPNLLNFKDVSTVDPTINLIVTFKTNETEYSINSSNRMRFSAIDARLRPNLSWNGKHRVSYTIVFLDMDAPFGRDDPRNSVGTQYLHWLVLHADSETFQISELGQETVPYAPPSPPSTGGNHRYVLVLLAESTSTPQFPMSIPQGLNETSGEAMVDRTNFNFQDFKENNFLNVSGVEYFISPPSSHSFTGKPGEHA